MLDQLDLTKVLVLDIETVPQKKNYEELDELWKALWEKKMKFQIKENITAQDLYDQAGIYSEFGKIICISCGVFTGEKDNKFRVKSYYGDDEKEILNEFSGLLEKNFSSPDNYLCAHNGKEFDYPYIARRCIINGIRIPAILDNSGKKPWEVRNLDTMDMWKFGDYKSYTSLILLAGALGIKSPKDDIDGSQVGKVYWQDKDTERIAVYCQKDVVTVAQILLKFKGMELLNEEEIVYIKD
ncbi:MAG: 3'-5' exonuclease [Bacteroidetes bacterium]|nr:3'-5' exonuclease [Bacteroidota bacterium]